MAGVFDTGIFDTGIFDHAEDAANEGGWLFRRRVPRFHIDVDGERRYFDTEAEALEALRGLRQAEKVKPKRLRRRWRIVKSPDAPAREEPRERPKAVAVTPEPLPDWDEEDEELLLMAA